MKAIAISVMVAKFPSISKKAIDYVNVDFNSNSRQVIPGVKWVDDRHYRKFSKLLMTGAKVEYNFSNTAIYSPFSYAPSVVAFKLAELLNLRVRTNNLFR